MAMMYSNTKAFKYILLKSGSDADERHEMKESCCTLLTS